MTRRMRNGIDDRRHDGNHHDFRHATDGDMTNVDSHVQALHRKYPDPARARIYASVGTTAASMPMWRTTEAGWATRP